MIGGVFDYCINGDENGLNQSLTESEGWDWSQNVWTIMFRPHMTYHSGSRFTYTNRHFPGNNGKIFCAWTLQRWFGSPWYVPIRAADFASSRFLRTASLSTCLALSAEFVLKRWPTKFLEDGTIVFTDRAPFASTHSHINAPQYDF